ncbi:MAG: NigD-like protein [Paludibacter sp.]|nr:NigD-like protein [Paludibacter sp.]
MKKLFLLLLPFLLLTSCDKDDDNYSLDHYWVDIATLNNPDNSSFFFFTLDDSTRLWTAASALKYYRPKDGQRAIVNYTILNDKPASSGYNHDVKLNDVYEVLTKNIFNLTPATADSIGNDYITIEDIWIGSNFLNVEFVYQGGHKIHYINLVSDNSKTYTDGKIHLEFRHNSNGDYPSIYRWGMVSFNLKSLQVAGKNAVDIVIHTKEFSTGNSNRTYNFTYKYGASSSRSVNRTIKIPLNPALMR